jgi:hypothetical protein
VANAISGNCGIPGALVALGLTATAVATADGSGNFTFSGLSAGEYIVFPQLYGYGFSPSGTIVTIASTDIAGVNFTATVSPSPLGVWNKQGIVLTNFSFEPSVIYEGNAQILSGNVFKMWYMGSDYAAPNINYAESTDGITWTQYSGNPVIPTVNSGRVFKVGVGNYVAFYNNNGFTSVNRYTSTDGVHWTLTNSGVLTVGSAGAWDDSQIYNMQIVQAIGNNWTSVYGGNRVTNILNSGFATSTDAGVTWTKNPANPIIKNFSSAQVLKVNGVWYAWGDVTIYGAPSAGFEFPTTFARTSSLDLVNWTTPVQSLSPSLFSEVGPASDGGWQFDSPAVVEANGKTYMFYGCTLAAGGSTQGQIGMAVANGHLSSIVSVAAEGVIGPGISLVQEVHNFSFTSSGTIVLAYPKTVNQGDLLLAWVEASSIPDPLPTDTQANNWFVLSIKQSGGFGLIRLYAAFAKSTGANTLTFTGLGGSAAAQAVDFTGNLIGIYNSVSGSGTGTIPTQAIAALAANLVFGCCCLAGGAVITPAIGWTAADGSSGADDGGIYQIPTMNGQASPTWSMSPSGGWGVIAATFGATQTAFPLPSVGSGSSWLTTALNNGLRGLRH